MELDRTHTHRTTTTTSELFVCFTSRLSSSSSMRLTSSKSIHSPGRSSDKPPPTSVSLSNSLSRRLRNNGSLKGGQSPMFPSNVGTSKKRGCNFDNPEPSSPKVTCIGQVRVKTKKQGKKMKMRACGRSSRRQQNGEASFRRIEQGGHGVSSGSNQGGLSSSSHHHLQHSQSNSHIPHQQHRNQKWVHFPVTICEALRTFGSEFSCFSPCKSSSSPCFSSNNGTRDEREKTHEHDNHNHYHHHHHQGNRSHNDSNSSSCGAVFRWLVAFNEGEGKTRDIELVVGGEEEEERVEGRRSVVIDRECSSRRRSIFDDMDFKDDIFGLKDDENDNGGEEGRSSICVPPKNALLLMRCRSDPLRMSALANKFWEAPAPPTNEDTEEDEDTTSEEEEEEDDQQEEEEEEEQVEEQAAVPAPVDEANIAYKLGLHEEKAAAEVSSFSEKMDDEWRLKDDEEMIEDWVLVDADDIQEVVEDLSINSVEEQKEKAAEELLVEMQKEGGQSYNKVEEVYEHGLVSNRQSIELVPNRQSIELVSNRPSIDLVSNRPSIELVSNRQSIELVSNRQSIDYAISLPRLFESSELDYIEKEVENEAAANYPSCQCHSPSLEQNQATLEDGEVSDFGDDGSESSSSSSTVTTEEVEDDEKAAENKSTEMSSELRNQDEPTQDCDSEGEDQKDEEEQLNVKESTNDKNALPDCLLLMMCEPKLSMEVSKETWVCRTDFLRCLPDRQHRPQHQHLNPKPKDQDHQQLVDTTKEKKKTGHRPSPNANPPAAAAPRQNPLPPGYQPPRSSCSFPLKGGASMASMIEQKLVNAVAYEPFVLTRCKSEPMRSAAAKFGATPELACFWKNRKLEPHRPATFGATGLGF